MLCWLFLSWIIIRFGKTIGEMRFFLFLFSCWDCRRWCHALFGGIVGSNLVFWSRLPMVS
ncbi:hypothetical protein Hdeb2414_s0010g00336851 [Helianthus debilis subsp. tardiflorus]